MRKLLRLAVLGGIVAAALGVVGSALATPKLIIGRLTAAGPVRRRSGSPKVEPTLLRMHRVYAPAGYSATVTATQATVLGTAHADLQALAISPDAIIQADGHIIAADPAANPKNACARNSHRRLDPAGHRQRPDHQRARLRGRARSGNGHSREPLRSG